MAFYVGKGLQVAGLVGVAWALYLGLTRADAIIGELVTALGSAALFYGGRFIEARADL
jgi:translation initiation factor 2 gamma subunit (eIF-2gamma)